MSALKTAGKTLGFFFAIAVAGIAAGTISERLYSTDQNHSFNSPDAVIADFAAIFGAGGAGYLLGRRRCNAPSVNPE